MSRLRTLGIALLLAGSLRLAHAQDAGSDVYVHRVAKGDTLQILAAEFYGDRTKAIYIMVANKLDHPRPLKPGERMKIPVTRRYLAAPGDTFETIAANFLGDAKRGPFLAEFNGRTADERLASGTELWIPFAITHTAQATESIESIGAAYFGSNKFTQLIRRYNFLEADKTSIDKGDKLVIPIFNVKLAASKLPPLDATSRERLDRQKRAQALAVTAIPAAKQAWRDGDFSLVRDTLAEVEPDVDFLETEQAVDVGVLIGAMRVAFDDRKSALEAFKRVLDRKRDHTLSPYLYPKKVLDVWEDARRSENP